MMEGACWRAITNRSRTMRDPSPAHREEEEDRQTRINQTKSEERKKSDRCVRVSTVDDDAAATSDCLFALSLRPSTRTDIFLNQLTSRHADEGAIGVVGDSTSKQSLARSLGVDKKSKEQHGRKSKENEPVTSHREHHQ